MESIPTTPLAIIGAVVIVLSLIVMYFVKTQGQMGRANDVSDRSEYRSDRSEARDDVLQEQMISLLSDVKNVVANNTDVIKDSRLYMQLLAKGQEECLRKMDGICSHVSEENGNWKVTMDQLGRIEREVK